MAENYLDVTKSVIISSPAGSGKTEKLSRRYISLLESGSTVEKVLCITFTERAAAEMKHRILSILGRENPQLLAEIKEKLPLMRISTIHSFCLNLLKRFSIDLGLDPAFGIMEELEAGETWHNAVYEVLAKDREDEAGFFEMITARGVRGWGPVLRALDEIQHRRPYPELLRMQGGPRKTPGDDGSALLELYYKCLDTYTALKASRRKVDFEDLELLAHTALSSGPEWHNILYSFDEHTEHVLVDEFQDTSTLQWQIIQKLTEEWRSGMGSQREAGKTPTIFLVGDEKQSIYLFRGANVSVFNTARENFKSWLGTEHHFIEATENYRSLPEIVDFVNSLFERLMPPDLVRDWLTRYTPFEAKREGKGKVQLVLLNARENTHETRQAEARALAGKISELHGEYRVYTGEGMEQRPCDYSDMAILLRKRTHLGLLEDALRTQDVPFVVLKGIGFYEAPEVALLRDFICFTVDPTDRYSLFQVLRSSIFNIDERTLTRLLRSKTPLLEAMGQSKVKKLKKAADELEGWAGAVAQTGLAGMLEQALTQSGAWSHFWEPQRHANIRKFLAMVESYEADGLSTLEIREKLLRQRHANQLPKANINPEGVDAVRILTIHSAKGLQFPMVFLPSMDESIRPRSGPVVLDDAEDGSIVFGFNEDTAAKGKDETFRLKRAKETEEEKRLFYVAVTRARDYLCMTGANAGKKTASRLSYLDDAFGVLDTPVPDAPFEILLEDDLPASNPHPAVKLADARDFVNAPLYTDPLLYEPRLLWQDATPSAKEPLANQAHDGGWLVAGRIMHRVLEEVSRDILLERNITERTAELLRHEGLSSGEYQETMLRNIMNMHRVGLFKEIVQPQATGRAYTELPFVLERKDKIYKGRIDRVIIKNNIAFLYDYKTFPVNEAALPALKEHYAGQMSVYKEAVQQLFGLRTKAYLLFTSLPRLIECQ